MFVNVAFNSNCWFVSVADVVLMSVRLEFTLLRPTQITISVRYSRYSVVKSIQCIIFISECINDTFRQLHIISYIGYTRFIHR